VSGAIDTLHFQTIANEERLKTKMNAYIVSSPVKDGALKSLDLDIEQLRRSEEAFRIQIQAKEARAKELQ
jgi:hypothetical protein